jgi:transposase
MIDIDISEQQAEQLEYFRYNYPDPLIQRRFEVIWLKFFGFKQLKCGHIPAKADLKQQKKFLDESLNPRLEEARTGKRAVLFMDSAHFVHAIFVGLLWCISRVFIKSASGRSRFNVLGAIDAITQQLFTVCNETYINANSICEMLRKLALHYAGTPITIVLDNARYQKCKIVAELAFELGVELLYLPSYSPNLNLIERLWKFVKTDVLYCKYYSSFASFKESIDGCLSEVNTIKKQRIASLLNLKFHIPTEEAAMAA